MDRKKIEQVCNKTIEWTFWALLVLVPLYFDPQVRGVFDVPKMCLLRWCSLIIIGTWLLKMLLTSNWRFSISKLDWPVWVFLGVSVLATTFAFDPYVSLIGAYKRHEGLITTISYVLIFFVATNFLTDKKVLWRAIYVAILVGILSSLYALGQRMGLDPIHWEADVTGRAVATFGNPIFLGAYLATIIPLALAIFLGFGLGKQKVKPLPKKKKEKKKEEILDLKGASLEWILGLSLPLMYAALFFAGSRGPLLGFLFGLILLFLFTYRAIGIGLIPIYGVLFLTPYFGGLIACAAGIVCIYALIILIKKTVTENRIKMGLVLSSFFVITLYTGFASSSLADRVVSTVKDGIGGKAVDVLPAELGGKASEDEPAKKLNKLESTLAGLLGNRYWIWMASCLIASKYPQEGGHYGPLTFPYCGLVLGTGLDTMKWVYPRYEPPGMEKLEGHNVDYDRAHNEMFDTLVTKGLIGVFSYFWLLGAFVFFWWQGYQKADSKDRIIMLGLMAGWAAYIIQNQFAFPVVSFTPLFWLIMGVTMKFSGQVEQKVEAEEPKKKPQILKITSLQAGLALIIVVVVIILGTLAFFPYRADYYFNKGERAVHDGNLDLAVEMYEKAVAWNPKERHYYGELTYTYYKKTAAIPDTNLEKKKEWLAKTFVRISDAFKVNQKDGYFYNILGATYALAFDLGSSTAKQKAIDSYNMSFKYNLVFAEPHNNLGALYSKLQEYDKAVECYKKVLHIIPNDTQCMSVIGDIYFKKGDLETAIKWLKKALSVDPNQVNPHHRLGEICFNQGKYDDSAREFREILKLEPDRVEVYRDLGAAYFRGQRFKEAKEAFEIYLRYNPNDRDIRALVDSIREEKPQ